MQEAPAGAAAPVEGGGEPTPEEGQAVSELVNNVGEGLTILADLVAKTKDAPPEAQQLAQGLIDGLGELINMMSGGPPSQAPEPAPPGGMSQANAGSGARPAGPGVY
jgi:hypothetical protein